MTEEQLINLFKDGVDLYEILSGYYEKVMPDGFEFIKDNTVEYYDSYGYEDTKLEIIVKHIDSGRYLSIYGTRQSYNGTEVSGVKEVKPREVVTTIFE